MIEKCAGRITNWLLQSEAIEESDQELYEYAVFSILLTVSPIFLAIFVGFLLGCVWRSVLIILPFVIIRKFSGGYHTRRAETCLIGSSLLLILCIVLSFYVQCGWTLMWVSVGATASLVYFSPIDNDNRLLSREEQISYKKSTIMIAVLFFCVDLLLFLFQLYIGAICISIGIIMSAGLQIPALFSKFRKSKKRTKNIEKMLFDVRWVEIMAETLIIKIVIDFIIKVIINVYEMIFFNVL